MTSIITVFERDCIDNAKRMFGEHGYLSECPEHYQNKLESLGLLEVISYWDSKRECYDARVMTQGWYILALDFAKQKR